MVDFKTSQSMEEYMWTKYSAIIKDVLTKNNPNSKMERVSGILDYECGIDAVILNPNFKSNSIRFISLRILNHNYSNFTFRIPHTNKKRELDKLLSSENPTPYYHIQITEGCNGTQIAMLNINKLSEYVEQHPEFWFVISEYIIRGERNNYYSIPMNKFKRFIKIHQIDSV